MILVFDIGNTNIVIGLFEKNKLQKRWRLPTSNKKSADDYAVDIIELFLTDKIDCLKISGTIISSVVPIATARIHEAVKKFTTSKILIVGKPEVKLNVDIKVKNKKEVGYDRLINTIAAYKKYEGKLIIIDFGTATTFDVVGKEGEYLGGVISPGINLSLKALHDMTAQLPKISIKPQSNVIGKTTMEAMNSGVYFGYISLVEGLVKKIDEELGFKTKKIVTGGLAQMFKEALGDLIDYHDEDLTLNGLLQVYKVN